MMLGTLEQLLPTVPNWPDQDYFPAPVLLSKPPIQSRPIRNARCLFRAILMVVTYSYNINGLTALEL